MKTLVIYDMTGRIYTMYSGSDAVPQGIPCMYVDIPEGAQLERIDVTDPDNPQPVFSDGMVYISTADLQKQINEIQNVILPALDIDACTLDELKEYTQNQNKSNLSSFLKDHPLLWVDGEYYGVTKEDQDEMIADKAAYDLKQAIGFTDWQLEWHNAKKACRVFEVEEFLGLLNAIVDFVYPYRKLQELYKEMIYSAETIEEVLAVNISYVIEQADKPDETDTEQQTDIEDENTEIQPKPEPEDKEATETGPESEIEESVADLESDTDAEEIEEGESDETDT